MIDKMRIVMGSEELFSIAGIKAVTMDEIASYLGVSKTLYMHFVNKDELILAIVKKNIDTYKRDIITFVNEPDNAVNKLSSVTKYILDLFSRSNPIHANDLQKYYPAIWLRFQGFKETFLTDILDGLLKLGIEQSLVIPGLNTKILARMRINQIELGFDRLNFPESPMKSWEIQNVFSEHFYRGALTPAGLKVLLKNADS